MGEYVAIGRSLLQQCHWGKKSPLGEDGRGRDREIAPTALPLGEEVAIGGRKRSRSGDRSYSIAIGGRWKRSRSGDRSYSIAIGGRWKRSRSGDRSYSNAIGGRKRSRSGDRSYSIAIGGRRGRDREIAPTAMPLGEEGRGRDLLFLQTMPNHRPLIADR